VTDIPFFAPDDVSVARLRIVGPNGEATLDRGDSQRPENTMLITPQLRSVHIVDPRPGSYTAIIEPLGRPPITFPFVIHPTTAEVHVPALSELEDSTIPPDWSFDASEVAHLERLSHREVVSDMPPRVEREIVYRPEDAAPARRVGIGLSVDTRPMARGGWKPYEGPWSVQLRTPDSRRKGRQPNLTLERTAGPLVRSGALLPTGKDGVLVRLSVAIAGLRVQRLLLPLFVGGVEVAFVAKEKDIEIDVRPTDPGFRSLVRALSDAVGDEGPIIWQDFCRTQDVDRFIFADIDEDPWIATVAGLLMLRFDTISDPRSGQWAEVLSKRYPWIPDCQILLARMLLLRAGAGDGDRTTAASDALAALQHARKLGAPYFSYANMLLGEMLDSLADGAPTPDQQELARAEIGGWRKQLPRQRSAGASFSWSTLGGEWTRGGLDTRYTQIIATGQVDGGGVVLAETANT